MMIIGMTIHCMCSRSLSSEDRMSGRSDDRLAKYKTRLQRKVMVLTGTSLLRDLTSATEQVQELVRRQGWVPAGVLGAVLSLQLDLGGLNSSVVRVRGHVTACHQSPVCLDLACGRCFDPLTSVHADCGLHSYFKVYQRQSQE